jgi:hypothetical protein
MESSLQNHIDEMYKELNRIFEKKSVFSEMDLISEMLRETSIKESDLIDTMNALQKKHLNQEYVFKIFKLNWENLSKEEGFDDASKEYIRLEKSRRHIEFVKSVVESVMSTEDFKSDVFGFRDNLDGMLETLDDFSRSLRHPKHKMFEVFLKNFKELLYNMHNEDKIQNGIIDANYKEENDNLNGDQTGRFLLDKPSENTKSVTYKKSTQTLKKIPIVLFFDII